MPVRLTKASSVLGHIDREHFDEAWTGQTPRDLRARYCTGEPESWWVIGRDGNIEGDALDVPTEDGDLIIIAPALREPGTIILTFILLSVTLIQYALASMRSRTLPPVRRGDEQSPTYTWDGTQTSFGPGQPKFIVLGHERVAGQSISSDVKEDAGAFEGGEILNVGIALSVGECYRIGDIDAGACGEVDDLGGINRVRSSRRDLPAGLKINGNLVPTDSRNVEAHLRMGTPHQSPMRHGFDNARTLFTVNQTIPGGNGRNVGQTYVYQTTGTDIDEVQLSVRFPQGLYKFQNGKLVPYDDPELFRTDLLLQYRWREVGQGAWPAWRDWPINHKTGTRAPFSTSLAIGPGQFGKRGQWEIEVGRVSVDDSTTEFELSSATELVSVTEVTKAELAYPRMCLMGLGMRGTERFSGVFHTASVPLKGVLVRTYDSNTTLFSDYHWLGSSSEENGRNPAWLFLECVVNQFWGGGRLGLTVANLDLDSIEEWADYCDEQVTGPDGLEPRHRCDLVVDTERDMWDWLLAICRTGRALPLPYGDQYKIVVDKPKATSQFFTDAGIRNVRLRYLLNPDRATVLDCEIRNAAKDWELEPIPVEDNEAELDPTKLDADTIRRETLSFLGTTRESEARREAIFIHRENALIVEEIRFRAPLSAVTCEVWDRINVQTSFPRWFSSAPSPPAVVNPWNAGYRTTRDQTATNSLYLDHDVTLAVGKSYQVLIRTKDDTPVIRNVTSAAGTISADSAITFDGATLDYEKEVEAAIGELDYMAKDFRIIDLTFDAQTLEREVVAVTYDPAVYTIPSQDAAPQDDGYPANFAVSSNGLNAETAIASVGGIDAMRLENGLTRVSWERPSLHRNARFRVYLRSYALFDAARANPGPWDHGHETDATFADVPLESGVDYDIAVAVRDRAGKWTQQPDEALRIAYVAEEFAPFAPGSPQ